MFGTFIPVNDSNVLFIRVLPQKSYAGSVKEWMMYINN